MKCRKVEMRENAAHRISLPITFAAHHFLCADQLPRAGRFHCADSFILPGALNVPIISTSLHREVPLLLLLKSLLTGSYPACLMLS